MVTVPLPVDIEPGSDEEGNFEGTTPEDSTQNQIHAVLNHLSHRNIIHLNIETVFHLLHETLRRNRHWIKYDWATIIKDTWFSTVPEVSPSLQNAVTWRIGSGMMYVKLEDLVQGGGNLCHFSGGLMRHHTAVYGAPQEMSKVREVTTRSEMQSQRCSFQSFGTWVANVSMPSLHSLHLHTIGPLNHAAFDLKTVDFEQFTSLRQFELQLVDQDLSWEYCEPLLVLTQLEELSIITIQSVMESFHDKDMWELARSLPNLQHLHLAFGAQGLTSRSLRHLQVHCRKLISFGGLCVGDFGDDELRWEGQKEYEKKETHPWKAHKLRILDLPGWRPQYEEASWVQNLFPSAVTFSGEALSDYW